MTSPPRTSRGWPRAAAPLLLLAGLAAGWAPARAELLEEIVAFVNGDVITKSELEQQEQVMLAEAYKRFTGADLDTQVKTLRENMLVDMVDQRILLDRAKTMFSDLEGIKKMYYDGFKENQGIEDDAEFAKVLQQEGMTVDEFKQRLLEIYAPEEVLRLEVRNRISVSDREVEKYYNDHLAEFDKKDEVTVREIVLLADTEEKKAARRPEAEKIVERARSGEDFAEVAGAVSESGTKDKGGLLGPVGRGDLAQTLEAVAFSLPAGQVSDPLETPYGFHILKVESRTVGQRATLDEVREQLREFIEGQKYDEDLDRFRKRVRSEAEWCVKRKYRDRVPAGVDAETCEM